LVAPGIRSDQASLRDIHETQCEESFFAISASRRFPNSLVRELLATPGGLPPPLAGARWING
jgi:hypothetical protein